MTERVFKRLTISGWRQFHSIDIELHPHLTIITGANGAGKSTLLSFFTRHFGFNRSFLGTPETREGVVSYLFGLYDALKRGLTRKSAREELSIGTLEYSTGEKASLRLPSSAGLHYSVDIQGEQPVAGVHIDSHRPPNIYRSVSHFQATPPDARGIGSSLNSEFTNFYHAGSIGQGSLHHIKMALIQMSIFGHGNATMEPIPSLVRLFNGFEEKLKVLLPRSLGFRKLIIRSPEVLLSTETGDFLIDAASGGVIKLFEVAWQIYFFSQGKNRFVVTFDEPENHLHPSMQKTFLPNIMAAFPGIQVIAVTHSPFIISAMRDSFVYVLRYADTDVTSIEVDDDQSIRGLMGSRVVAQKLDTVNKAGTASEILRDVLGITTTIPDWAENRLAEIVSAYRDTPVTEERLQQLFEELQREGLVSSYPAAISILTRPA